MKFLHIRLFLCLFLLLFSGLFLSACIGEAAEPLTFRPELFTRPEQGNDEECFLAVGNVDVTFSELNAHDAKIRISGIMNRYCSNLQVSMNAPDIGKNINIEVAASTTSASGGNDRPFEVELHVDSLRFGSYTVWINGEAMKIFSVE